MIPGDPVFGRNCPVERSQESETRNWSLNLNFPIYTGGLNSSRVQQAVFRHRAAQQDMERIARQTERETRDAYLGVIAEISRVEALRQAVESNRTALRATEAGFEVGTQTTVDVLAAQDNLRRAETNYAIREVRLHHQSAHTCGAPQAIWLSPILSSSTPGSNSRDAASLTKPTS